MEDIRVKEDTDLGGLDTYMFVFMVYTVLTWTATCFIAMAVVYVFLREVVWSTGQTLFAAALSFLMLVFMFWALLSAIEFYNKIMDRKIFGTKKAKDLDV